MSTTSPALSKARRLTGVAIIAATVAAGGLGYVLTHDTDSSTVVASGTTTSGATTSETTTSGTTTTRDHEQLGHVGQLDHRQRADHHPTGSDQHQGQLTTSAQTDIEPVATTFRAIGTDHTILATDPTPLSPPSGSPSNTWPISTSPPPASAATVKSAVSPGPPGAAR